MHDPRPEVIVAATLYLISGGAFDPSPCACRVKAIVAHLEKMMDMTDLDPVLRATAIQLHESWHRVAEKIDAALEAQAVVTALWH
ncbi:MAG: hypothetical protein ABI277_07225 [Burkholderiaceae bacterium]